MRKTVDIVICDRCGHDQEITRESLFPPGWVKITFIDLGTAEDNEQEADICGPCATDHTRWLNSPPPKEADHGRT